MAIQPIISKPGAVSQRPPIVVQPAMPLWVPLMMVFVTALSVVALVFSLLKAPAQAQGAGHSAEAANALNISNIDNAPVEEGKEMQVKIADMERQVSQFKAEVSRLNEELISVRASVDGLNANVSIVQSQTAKLVPPVNIQNLQPDTK